MRRARARHKATVTSELKAEKGPWAGPGGACLSLWLSLVIPGSNTGGRSTSSGQARWAGQAASTLFLAFVRG